MRRGLKIGLGILGLGVLAAIVGLSSQPEDRLQWVRVHGGKQTSYVVRNLGTSNLHIAEFKFEKLSPAFLREVNRQMTAPINPFPQGSQSRHRENQVILVYPNKRIAEVYWEEDKSWFEQKWAAAKKMAGF